MDSSLYRPADFIDAAGGNIGWALAIGLVLLVLLLVLCLGTGDLSSSLWARSPRR